MTSCNGYSGEPADSAALAGFSEVNAQGHENRGMSEYKQELFTMLPGTRHSYVVEGDILRGCIVLVMVV